MTFHCEQYLKMLRVSRLTASSTRLLRSLSSRSLEPELPSHCKVAVIGGGIIGNSIAYHLASMGVSDVILLEQNQLTSGTTWHAAGLMVTFGSLSETSTEIRKYSRHLYETLEAETGLATGFKPVGKFLLLRYDCITNQ